MTVAHSGPTIRAETPEGAIDELRANGMRISAARRIVIEALFAAKRPVTAEQIAAGLGDRLPPSDVASVYRNLESLEKAGLVRHFHAGHGPGLYTTAGAREREYLVCEECGGSIAVDSQDLEPARELIRRRFGFEARFTHFPILGICAECGRR